MHPIHNSENLGNNWIHFLKTLSEFPEKISQPKNKVSQYTVFNSAIGKS